MFTKQLYGDSTKNEIHFFLMQYQYSFILKSICLTLRSLGFVHNF